MRSRVVCRMLLILLCLTLSRGTSQSQGHTAASTSAGDWPADAQDIALVGRLGGLMTAVFVQGGYAYLGVGDQLLILNVTDPTQPKRAGGVRLPDDIRDVVVAGRYAYVATSRTGLRIVDVADPGAAVEVGAFEPDLPPDSYLAQEAAHIRVAGQYAYLTTRDGLEGTTSLFIVDITSASAPLEISRYDMPYSVYDLQVRDRYVYLASYEGVWILDIGDPARPAQVHRYDLRAFSFALAGRYAYVSSDRGIVVLDLGNPAAPTEAGQYEGGWTARMMVAGANAYLYGGSTLLIVSLRDPIAPVYAGRYEMRSSIPDLAVVGDHGYVIDGDTLRVLRVADPSAPVEVGHFAAPSGGRGIALDGHYAYVSSSGSFSVVDVSTPAVPVEVGHINFALNNFMGTHVVVQGQYAYVAGLYHGLSIVDISEPAAPVVVGRVPRADISDVVVAGRYAYVITATFGDDCVCVVDLVNPAAPTIVSKLPGTFGDIELAGQYVYVTSGGSLQVLSLDNPAAPKQVGVLMLLAYDVTVAGGYAYVLTLNGEVGIIDVAKPAALKQVGSLPISAGMAIAEDGHLYVGSYQYPESARLRIFDISNPLEPFEVAHAVLPDGLADLTTRGRDIYAVGTGLEGGEFAILRYSGPSINGQARHANGMPFPGVTITAGAGRTSTTDARGLYRIEELPAGAYTVAPASGGYRSWPTASTVTLPPSGRGRNFVMLAHPVTATFAPGTAGTLAYSDTQGLRTELAVPAGALAQNATLVVTPTLAPDDRGMSFTGHAIEVSGTSGASELSFTAPLTLTIRYSDADVRVVTDESRLVLRRWDGRAWQDAAQTCDGAVVRDVGRNMISAPICGSGRYALFGPTNQLYMPLLAH